jgi:pimeloyl-ACP methyl ester carboxylesterase
VYAPDLPGYGESDSSPARGIADAAAAIFDLVKDLRLRQIDVMGVQYGAEVAIELAAAQPELVRRVVLATLPATERLGAVQQPRLVLDITGHGADPFGGGSQALAKQVNAFLRSRP